ncbi:hypothetical protein QCA50_013120 [Cerrena zonata]|uniref:Cyclin N-terminal domain-containing protein n=1 Tax=Cerrena zonata TaxID=2478898 RepID=A0AAW0FWG1_9APHY
MQYMRLKSLRTRIPPRKYSLLNILTLHHPIRHCLQSNKIIMLTAELPGSPARHVVDDEPQHFRYSDLETPRSRTAFNERISSILTQILRERRARASHTPDSEITPQHSPSSVLPLDTHIDSPVLSASSSGYEASDSSCSAVSCSTIVQSPVPLLHDSVAAGHSRETASSQVPKTSSKYRRTEGVSTFQTPSNLKIDTAIAIPDAPKKVQHTIRIARDAHSKTARTSMESLSGYEPGTDEAKETQINAYTQDSSHVIPKDTERLSPPTKKRRFIASRSSSKVTGTSRTIQNTHLAPDRFANRCASLRKAASLVSESSQLDETIEISPIIAKINSVSPVFSLSLDASDDELAVSPVSVKTEPVTPMPMKSAAPVVSKSRKHRRLTPFPDPLPIIAPPPYINIPRAPASPEEIAESRLKTMIEREQEERFDDGLDTKVARAMLQLSTSAQTSVPQAADPSDDDMTDDEKQLWKDLSDREDEAIQDSTPHKIPTHGSNNEDEDEDEGDLPYMCIEDEFRQEIVEWLLDTIPPSIPAKPQLCRELRAELTQCIDTRWHAVQLFIRYFIRIGTSPPCSPMHLREGTTKNGQIINTNDESAYFVWDIATACIALAVKFHRDVLSPLVPVFADEFLLMARHSMTYDDFETAQRHVLSTFDFCIGSLTPGAYMEELWNALPSLRILLDTKPLWETAKKLAWEMLSDALFDIDHVRYRTSTLTACALVRGISETLIIQKKEQSKTARFDKVTKVRRDAKCTCAKINRSISRVVHPVELDIMDILKINEEDWMACKEWLILLDV